MTLRPHRRTTLRRTRIRAAWAALGAARADRAVQPPKLDPEGKQSGRCDNTQTFNNLWKIKKFVH